MKRTKKFLQRFISVVVCCVIVSSFFIVGVSAEESSELLPEGDYIYFFENFQIVFYRYDLLESFFNGDDSITEDDIFVKFTFKAFLDDSGARFVLFPLESNYIFSSGSPYLFLFSPNPDISLEASGLSFPKSLVFSNASNTVCDILPMINLLPTDYYFTYPESSSDAYLNYGFVFEPTGNYPTFTMVESNGPVTAPDTVLPPVKEYISSVGSFFSFTLDKAKDVFNDISETPALAIFCIGFVVLGFVLAWLRKLIVNSS